MIQEFINWIMPQEDSASCYFMKKFCNSIYFAYFSLLTGIGMLPALINEWFAVMKRLITSYEDVNLLSLVTQAERVSERNFSRLAQHRVT